MCLDDRMSHEDALISLAAFSPQPSEKPPGRFCHHYLDIVLLRCGDRKRAIFARVRPSYDLAPVMELTQECLAGEVEVWRNRNARIWDRAPLRIDNYTLNASRHLPHYNTCRPPLISGHLCHLCVRHRRLLRLAGSRRTIRQRPGHPGRSPRRRLRSLSGRPGRKLCPGLRRPGRRRVRADCRKLRQGRSRLRAARRRDLSRRERDLRR